MHYSIENPIPDLNPIAAYYSRKVAIHGPTAAGVDWNGEESQALRFTQLIKVIEPAQDESLGVFSINDLGCGYGAFFNYLRDKYTDFSYTGVDICSDMVMSAQRLFREDNRARFVVSHCPDRTADYGIASGIFNVRLTVPDGIWQDHMEATLETLDQTSRRGFAFNCLTIYSDREKMRDDLYYADPCRLFDRCKRKYSRHVSLLHNYGLFEFTILVRKPHG